MDDLISRQAVLKLLAVMTPEEAITKAMLIQSVQQMDAAQPTMETVTECNDLISRHEALKALKKNRFPGAHYIDIGVKIALREIKALPSAQPERKRGRWNITDAYPHNVYCSECYTRFAQTHWAVWEDGTLPRNFCPNCGADMRGEQNG